MSNSWFKQWLAVRKQVTFIIPILLLGLAFAVAVIVGKQASRDSKTSSAGAVLVVRSDAYVHCFEIDTQIGKVIKHDLWLPAKDFDSAPRAARDLPKLPTDALFVCSEEGRAIWIQGDSLMTGTVDVAGKSTDQRLIVKDEALKAIGAGSRVLLWGRKRVGKPQN